MEPGHEGGDLQHAPSGSSSKSPSVAPGKDQTASTTASSASHRSSGPPEQTAQHPAITAAREEPPTMAHDSMVTVRLSDATIAPRAPTALSRETGPLGISTPEQVRASPKGHDGTEEEGAVDPQGKKAAAEGLRPDNGRNLLEELQDNDDNDDDQDLDDQPTPRPDGRDTPTTPTADNSPVESETAPTSEAEDVDWEHLQKHEDQQSKDQESDNTALLLARLEQENAKLATNPKSAKVKSIEKKPAPPSPSMAQLRQMVHGPTPQALRYSMLPPPPMTDLEFYSALVKNYQQTAARLPTLLSNKLRKGIPPPLRGVVWQSMAGARDASLEEQFDRFSLETSPYEGIIGKDLGRSFPGVDMFRERDGEGQRMLGQVLKCYSIYDPEIGYCQGLAFIVGPLLMHMPAKQAFCVLVRLMESYDLRSSFLPDLSGLHVRIYQFRELLRANLPILSGHLDDLQVDPVYVSQWFLSFFAVTCPLPMLFRIYDVVFAEGASETLMRVALSLMRKNQARILACTEIEDVMQLLLSRGLWDCYHYNADEFVQDFVSLNTAVDREQLSLLEQGFRQDARLANKGGPNAARASDVATAASRFLGRLATSISNNSTFAPSSSSAADAAATTASATATATGAPTTAPSTQSPTRGPATTPRSDSNSSSIASLPSPPSASPSSPSATPSPPPSSAAATPTAPAAASATTTLSPGLAASPRPLSMLRRSASKQSLASTLNSMEANSSSASSAASVLSSTSTDATSLSRDSSTSDRAARQSHPAFGAPGLKPHPTATRSNTDSKYLNNQIEDLLTALSDLQRQQALLADQLQKEREEREEDRKVVHTLLDGLKQSEESNSGGAHGIALSPEPGWPGHNPRSGLATQTHYSSPALAPLAGILNVAEERFGGQAASRRSSILESKTQLRDQLARAKEQLNHELAKGQDSHRRVADLEQEISSLKEQVRETQTHVRHMHQDKQRLEKQIHSMRVRASGESSATSPPETGGGGGNAVTDWLGRATSGGIVSSSAASTGSSNGPANGGLRELKLGRARSTPSQIFVKRTSSSLTSRGASSGATPGSGPPPPARESLVPPAAAPAASEHEAILLELVQAKTGEAIAKQEAEEAKQKLENLRKAFGLAPGDVAPLAAAAAHQRNNSAATTGMGMFGRFANSIAETAASKTAAGASTGPAASPVPAAATATPTPAAASTGGGGVGSFFGWRR